MGIESKGLVLVLEREREWRDIVTESIGDAEYTVKQVYSIKELYAEIEASALPIRAVCFEYQHDTTSMNELKLVLSNNPCGSSQPVLLLALVKAGQSLAVDKTNAETLAEKYSAHAIYKHSPKQVGMYIRRIVRESLESSSERNSIHLQTAHDYLIGQEVLVAADTITSGDRSFNDALEAILMLFINIYECEGGALLHERRGRFVQWSDSSNVRTLSRAGDVYITELCSRLKLESLFGDLKHASVYASRCGKPSVVTREEYVKEFGRRPTSILFPKGVTSVFVLPFVTKGLKRGILLLSCRGYGNAGEQSALMSDIAGATNSDGSRNVEKPWNASGDGSDWRRHLPGWVHAASVSNYRTFHTSLFPPPIAEFIKDALVAGWQRFGREPRNASESVDGYEEIVERKAEEFRYIDKLSRIARLDCVDFAVTYLRLQIVVLGFLLGVIPLTMGVIALCSGEGQPVYVFISWAEKIVAAFAVTLVALGILTLASPRLADGLPAWIRNLSELATIERTLLSLAVVLLSISFLGAFVKSVEGNGSYSGMIENPESLGKSARTSSTSLEGTAMAEVRGHGAQALLEGSEDAENSVEENSKALPYSLISEAVYPAPVVQGPAPEEILVDDRSLASQSSTKQPFRAAGAIKVLQHDEWKLLVNAITVFVFVAAIALFLKGHSATHRDQD